MCMKHITAIAVAASVALAALALPGGARADDAIGAMQVHEARGEETFVALMGPYNLGYVELLAANPGVDPWLPEPGSGIVLPGLHILPHGEREGIIVNLADQRLYYFPEDGPTESYPVGIGREGWETPTGKTRIVRKRRNPTWIPTPSMREADPDLPASVPPGPENPLGLRALNLGWDYIVLHGTDRPHGVGRRVSHGCIRVANPVIADLFDRVSEGTPVRVVDQPVKLGWIDGALYLEAHPTQRQADELEKGERLTPVPAPSGLGRTLVVAAGSRDRILWDRVEEALARRTGIPVRVSVGAGWTSRRTAPAPAITSR